MDYASKLPRGGLHAWEDPKKGQPGSRVILEALAWASVTLVSVPSPERALLVSLTPDSQLAFLICQPTTLASASVTFPEQL